jgi:NADPH:quinone reductase-like Zn-dependent oxidoreductase
VRAYRVDAGAWVPVEHEGRVPGPGEAEVAVKPGVVPVSDGAGEVVAVGPGVDGVRPGDRVVAAIFPHWRDGPLTPAGLPQLGGSLDGMLTERAIVPAQALLPVPAHLSYEEAATLPCAAVTAWNALRGVRPGQRVLTTGTGGVSLFAVQLAVLMGARVVVSTGDPARERRLRALGADGVVARDAAWPTVDRVVHTAGPLERSLRALALDGHVALVGSVSGEYPAVDPRLLLASAATVRAVAVGSVADLAGLLDLMTAHGMRPVIDRVFPFGEAADALRHFETGRPFGKVVVTVR